MMSPTVQTILIGLCFIGVLVFLGRAMGGQTGIRKALYMFFPFWLAYCIWHLTVGMSHGYSFTSELLFLVINFGIPALGAFLVLKKWG